jgi:hypothetical protein
MGPVEPMGKAARRPRSARTLDMSKETQEAVGGTAQEVAALDKGRVGKIMMKRPALSRRTVELAEVLAEESKVTEDVVRLLETIRGRERRLEELGAALALQESQREEVEETQRNRTGMLRRAIIELGLDRTQLADSNTDGVNDGKLKDLDFQIAALEKRFAELEKDNQSQLSTMAASLETITKQEQEVQTELGDLSGELYVEIQTQCLQKGNKEDLQMLLEIQTDIAAYMGAANEF